MSSSYIYRSLFAFLGLIAHVVSRPLRFLAGVAITCVQFVASPAAWMWRQLVRFSLSAYRMIGHLKPIYRESYDTHGMNFVARC